MEKIDGMSFDEERGREAVSSPEIFQFGYIE